MKWAMVAVGVELSLYLVVDVAEKIAEFIIYVLR